MQLFVQMKRLVALALRELRHRNAGPPGDDAGDFLLGHGLVHQGEILPFHLFLFGFQLPFQPGQLAVGELRGLFQVSFPLGDLDFVVHRFDLFPQLRQPLHAHLLVVPLRLAVVELRLQLGQLLLQRFQPFPA